MAKVATSIYVEYEMAEHIKNNPEIESFSAWVAEKYQECFMRVPNLIREIDELEDRKQHKIKELQDRKAEERSIFDNLPREALSWLDLPDTRRRLKNFNSEAIYRDFINRFRLHHINRRQFKILVKGDV